MRRTIAAISLLLIALALEGCGPHPFRAEKSLTQTVEQIPGSPLVVKSRNGRVEVRASNAFTGVSIEAKIRCVGSTQQEADERLAQTVLRIERDTARTLTIKPDFAGSPRGGDGASIIVHLPDVDGLSIDTSNGSITISGAKGRLVAGTSNGSVKVYDHAGEAVLDTSNGSVVVERHTGDVEIDTSNGSVKVTDLAGAAQINTSNGSITLVLADGQTGPIDLATSNASIRATVSADFAGHVRMSTSNAGVHITDHLGIIRQQEIRKSSANVTMSHAGANSRLSTSNARVIFTIE